MRVYVSGPITLGDLLGNVRAAMDAAATLLKAGHIPFLPHLNVFWHIVHPNPSRLWMEWDLAWLRQCEALLRLAGDSRGADEEVEMAISLGLPVCYSIKEFLLIYGSPAKDLRT